jgi:hypothetical protein
MKIQCRTRKGGAVSLNTRHGVWASYAVAGVGDLPRPEILYVGAKLPGGRSVQFFLNRETGLVVVDVVARHGRGGNEVLRLNANRVNLPSGKQCQEAPCHTTG